MSTEREPSQRWISDRPTQSIPAGAWLLEDKPEGKLNQPRVIDGVIDDPKARWRVYVLLSTIAQAPHKKLRMVEQIEELSAELHTHSLAER
jgi:hypothetical protein